MADTADPVRCCRRLRADRLGLGGEKGADGRRPTSRKRSEAVLKQQPCLIPAQESKPSAALVSAIKHDRRYDGRSSLG